MNKAKKYYVGSQNAMVHRANKYDITSKRVTEKMAIPFYAKLKLTGLGWLNSGMLFYLDDEDGVTYVMNSAMMRECIKGTDIFIEGDFDFYQQGTSYSIGLVDENLLCE